MSRSISVTLSGIIALLGSLLMLLAGAAGAAAMAFGGNSAAAGRGAAGGPFFAFSLGFLLLVSLWGVGASIGIFFRANWARVSLIIFGTFLAIGCLSGSAAIFLLPTPSLTQSGGISFATVRVWIGIVYLLLAGLGIWWVFLFASKSVRVEFSGPVSEDDARPTIISIIAWLLIVGAASTPVILWFRVTFFLGLLVTGWASILVGVSLFAVQLYAGVGLLRLNPRSRSLAIYYSGYGLLNALLAYVLPGRDARFAAMYAAGMSSAYGAMMLITAVFMLVQIYFLVANRAAFYPALPDAASANP